jgi:DNA repair exonuclease SbcCD ATPase subunit
MTRTVRLARLQLRNFKGVDSFELTLDGHDGLVRGDNATGKTTLHDAYTWLLFGKDAANRSVFGIKTVDETGAARSGLEHEVAAMFLVDDTKVELSRTYTETWTKKRGSSTKELTGHSTAYTVDGVPMKKAEYDARVAELVGPEEHLRLLADPLYFASVLPWAERRNVLLDLVGAPTEEELAAVEPELDDLELERDPDDERKVLEQRRRKLNGELGKLPVRIDEVSRAAALQVTVPDDLDEQLATARAKVEEAEDELRAARATPKRDALVAKRSALQDSIAAREATLRSAHAEALSIAGERASHQRARVRELEAGATQSVDETAYARLTTRLDELRRAYAERQAETVTVDSVEDTCPACGQALPTDRVDEARRKALEDARARKARALREIYDEAESVSKRIGGLDEQRDRLERHAAELQDQLAEARAREKAAQAEADRLASRDPTVDDDTLHNLREQLAEVTTELESLSSGATVDTTDLEQARDAARAEVKRLTDLETVAAGRQQAEARLDELRSEERQLAGQLEHVDRQLYLLDLRTRVRAQLLTDRLNERFELVAFRLFDEQLNGALVETCDVTVAGVSWEDLNHGARMNAGLDVLRVLGQHYELSAPVWLDNAESVTRWLEIDAQTIRLEVDETATELAVELAA